jgi:hypothetical protein
LLAAALVSPLLVASCQAGQLRVDAYPTDERSERDCEALLADPPATVAGQPHRMVAGRVAAAWGDPPIILRCGVEKPAALKPNSVCHDINGVGWLADEQSDGWLFTTIGRRYFVSVEVPEDHEPAADALADLADVVARHDPVERPCL